MPAKNTTPKPPPFVSWPTAALLLLVLLVSGCKTLPQTPPSVPVPNVRVPPLPSYAVQPKTPPECSPSCLERLTTLRERWRQMLMTPEPQGVPANASTTPSVKP